MEWLDIVDNHDRVIGKDTRDKVHAGEHFHRSSHIVLFNSLGEVFVQLRSVHKDTNPGMWDTSAAGHVDSGESYLECAVRELREELGVSLQESAFKLIGKLRPQRSNGFEFTHIFSACSDQNPVLEVEEIDDGRWLTPEELNRLLHQGREPFTDVFRTIWSLLGEAHR